MLPQTDNIKEEKTNDGKDRIASYAPAPADKQAKKDFFTALLWVAGFFLLAYIAFRVVNAKEWL